MSDRAPLAHVAEDNRLRVSSRNRDLAPVHPVSGDLEAAPSALPSLAPAARARSAADVVALQRVLGNVGVQRLLARDQAASAGQAPALLRKPLSPDLAEESSEDEQETDDGDLAVEAGAFGAPGGDDVQRHPGPPGHAHGAGGGGGLPPPPPPLLSQAQGGGSGGGGGGTTRQLPPPPPPRAPAPQPQGGGSGGGSQGGSTTRQLPPPPPPRALAPQPQQLPPPPLPATLPPPIPQAPQPQGGGGGGPQVGGPQQQPTPPPLPTTLPPIPQAPLQQGGGVGGPQVGGPQPQVGGGPQPQGGGQQPQGGGNFLTWGIEGNTGIQNKVGKAAFNVGEGLLNALVGPLSPRWWSKARADILGIKKSDYGTGTSARVFQVLGITSQVVQKVGTVASVLSLALGIAGAVLGPLMGAGAACALGSAVCGLIAFIASCTAFILQSVLVFGNLIKQGWSAIKSDPDKKARFFGDLVGMIGSGLGVVGGGLGVNWGGGAGLFNSSSTSVLEQATQGIATSGTVANGAVTGSSSQGALVGQQFANFSMGQMAGTTGDTAGESIGALTRKYDPSAVVQREDESEGGESEGGTPNPEELKSGVAGVLSALSDSKSEDAKVKKDMQGSIAAIDKVTQNINKPMSATGVEPPKDGAPTDMPIASGVALMPGKVDQATQTLDTIETETAQSKKYSKKDSAKLENADEEVKKAEGQMGITGEEPKKPGLFKRFKDWLVNKVLNLKNRIKKLGQAAKAKLVGAAMDVMGISEKFEDMKGTTGEDRQSNVETIQAADESTSAATDAEEKAEEFASKL